MNPQVRLARTAGAYYLVVAIFAGFAQVVRQNVYVPDDAVATAANVVANSELVRLSFVADLVQATFALFLVLALSRLLRHVNKDVARAMVLFVVLQVGITCLNVVHQFAALLVATQPTYTSAFGAGQQNALVLLLMDMQHNGFLVAQIFFGLWLFPLGWLAYRSGMFPRPLGVVLMVATVAYLVDVLLQFLAHDFAATVSPIVVVPLVTVAEVSMVAYLLIKGVRTPPVNPKPPIGIAPATPPLVNA
ncbi:MAG: hypothetical protein QOE61_5841 [Micromonosporaceae bacterium]|nr:hypothetical protein [Micromonosporaceae bacterium]